MFIICLAAVILRSVALFGSFNTVTMHFDDKTAIIISGILVAISCLGFCSYLFLGEKERELVVVNNNAGFYIPAGIVSTAVVFMGVQNLILMLEGRYPQGPLPVLAGICALLAFLSAVSFFLSVFIEQNMHMYKAAFSLSIVFFLAFYAAMLFFNKQTHPTNSPNKLVDQFAYISAAIFFLYESRICLGRAKWRAYVSFGLISTLLCAYSAIPALAVYFVNGYTVSDSLTESVLSLALAILICSRVLQTRSLTPAGECEAARSITQLAMLRKDEIEENRKLARAHVNNIIEENDDTEDASNYTFDIPESEPATDFSQGEDGFDQ
jgi:hypothetical protein